MDTKQRAKLHKRFVERTGQKPSDHDIEKENHKYCRDEEWKVEEAQKAAAEEARQAELALEAETQALLNQAAEVQAQEDSNSFGVPSADSENA